MDSVENAPDSAHRISNPVDAVIGAIANRLGGRKAKEIERFIKFAIVGVSGAIVDFGVLIALQNTILPETSDLNVGLATSIAFTTAVISNFIWTRLWVYPDSRSRSIRRQLAQFSFISVIGGVARTGWVIAAYDDIGEVVTSPALDIIHSFIPGYQPSPEEFGTIVAQMLGMIVVMLWNFFANRYWTYNDVD